MSYASNTTVSVEKSQQEIQKILRNYGADKFGTMEDKEKAYIMFGYNNLMIQISIYLPQISDCLKTETGRIRKKLQVEQEHDKAIKRKWRSLVLLVKAKLVGVSDGITTIEKEFIGDIVMPDGATLSMKLLPRIEEIAATGNMPKLLSI